MLESKKKKKTKEVKKDYHIVLNFNFEVVEGDTNDISKFILDNAPKILRTNLRIKIINKEGKTYERLLPLQKARRVFWGRADLIIFIKYMIFK